MTNFGVAEGDNQLKVAFGDTSICHWKFVIRHSIIMSLEQTPPSFEDLISLWQKLNHCL